MVIPGGTRWLTTARAVSAPLALKASIQSLSSIPSSRASVSLIHDRPAARQGQHQQVFAVGGVDAPFLVRRQEVERFFREAIAGSLSSG
jgi:hypothetical protein